MPGKTEVSFEQWNHEVQCIKDYYPESAVQESIVKSLKGAAAEMAQFMGPTASVSNILQNVMVIFGMVASFDMLMQNFYKVTQGNHEKVPLFTMRLEGTLNQIRLKCPRWIADCEVTWYITNWLRTSGIPSDIYTAIPRPPTPSWWSQPAKQKVRRRRPKTKSGLGLLQPQKQWMALKELCNQIVRLMATLTRAEHGNNPASAPNSPRHRGHGRGQVDRNTPTAQLPQWADWPGLDYLHMQLLHCKLGKHCSSGKGEHLTIKWYPK